MVSCHVFLECCIKCDVFISALLFFTSHSPKVNEIFHFLSLFAFHSKFANFLSQNISQFRSYKDLRNDSLLTSITWLVFSSYFLLFHSIYVLMLLTSYVCNDGSWVKKIL